MCWGLLVLLLCGNALHLSLLEMVCRTQNRDPLDDAPSTMRRNSARNDSYCLRPTSAVKPTVNPRSGSFNSISAMTHGLLDKGTVWNNNKGLESDTYLVGLMKANQMCFGDFFFLSRMRLCWSALNGELQLMCTN